MKIKVMQNLLMAIMLFLVTLATSISGWYHGFYVSLALSLWVGVKYRQFVYYELINCKFKEISSYRFIEIHYRKKSLLIHFVFVALLTITGVILHYFQIVNIPVWARTIGIVIFVYYLTFNYFKYLAFSEYFNYLKNLVTKGKKNWDDDDYAFCDRLQQQFDSDCADNNDP